LLILTSHLTAWTRPRQTTREIRQWGRQIFRSLILMGDNLIIKYFV
jgi:hypothetical protein